MKDSDPVKNSIILQSLVGGKSALEICRSENITPMELMQICENQQVKFPNEIFESSLQDESSQFSINAKEHAKLLAEQERLINQIKEYEIEIRIHQDLLSKIVSKN